MDSTGATIDFLLSAKRDKGATVFLEQVAQTPFLRAVNGVGGERVRTMQVPRIARKTTIAVPEPWKLPTEVYFRTDDLVMYFAGNKSAWFLDELIYADRHDALLALGVCANIRMWCRSGGWNGHVSLPICMAITNGD